MPVYVAAHCRAVLLGIVCAKGVAEMAANEVAGRRIAGRVFVVVRSFLALESAVADGVDRDLIFHRRIGDRQRLSRCRFLQVRREFHRNAHSLYLHALARVQ